MIAAGGAFDRSWYLRQNPQLAAAGVDPVLHFALHGIKEGRDPSPLVGTRPYLNAAVKEFDRDWLAGTLPDPRLSKATAMGVN